MAGASIPAGILEPAASLRSFALIFENFVQFLPELFIHENGIELRARHRLQNKP